MPAIRKVYPDLVRDLELAGPLGPLSMGSEVFPVVLLDSLESFTAISARAIRVGDWFTQGVQVAPGAGTVLADTGALPVGIYDCTIIAETNDDNGITFQWRNAANAVNLIAHELLFRTTGTHGSLILRALLEVETADERFRLVNVNAGGVGFRYMGSILARAL